MNKNLVRPLKVFFIFILLAAVAITIKLSFSFSTVINDSLHMVLPAAVYISDDKELSFEYPDIFTAYSRNFSGGEILEHVDLLTENTRIHGFVEVWDIKTSLPVYLEKAKAAFSGSVKNFKESISSDNTDKVIWEYDVYSDSGAVTHVKQYFFKTDGKLIVASLFAPREEWSKKYDEMFEEIKNSVKLLE